MTVTVTELKSVSIAYDPIAHMVGGSRNRGLVAYVDRLILKDSRQQGLVPVV
jgi:hypothetical protein